MENREKKILDLSFGIFNQLENNLSSNAEFKVKSKDVYTRTLNNKDNIFTGELGELFFILELYKRSNNIDVKSSMINRLERIESFCKAGKTNNYTFFFGRMGLCYFYIDVFRFTHNEEYLWRAMNIVSEHIQRNSFWFALLNSCSLYDGAAGILLVLIHLYSETKEDWILHIIEKYTVKLLQDPIGGSCGISWNGLMHGTKRHAGLAYGGSGIALCLLELGRVSNNSAFYTLAKHALMYENDYWINKPPDIINNQDVLGVQGDTFLYGRHAAFLMSVYAADLLQEDGFASAWTKWIEDTRDLMADCHMSVSANVSEGWSGYGLVFSEAYAITKNSIYAEMADRAACKILDQRNAALIGDTSFIHGNCGVGYFLLRTILRDSNSNPSVVFPRVPKIAIEKQDRLIVGILSMDKLELFKKLLSKEFKYSYFLLNKYFPADVEECSADCNGFMILKIIQVFSCCIEQVILPDADLADLKYLFNKDVFLITVRLSLIDPMPEDTSFIQKTENLLLAGTDEFMNTYFIWHEKIRVFDGDEAFNFEKQMTLGQFAALFTDYGNKSFVCRLSTFGNMDIKQLSLGKIIFDRFISARKVKDVYDEMIDFLFSQNSEVLDLVKRQYEVDSDQQLQEKIYEVVRDMVKLLLSDGFLDFKAVSSN